MISFSGWRGFFAKKDDTVIRKFLHNVADEGIKTLKAGMKSGKSGRIYNRRGGSHQASAAGEYPAVDSGKLIKSADSNVVGIDRAEFGTDEFYAIFLRNGTSKMKRRKMSDDAMKETLKKVRFPGHFAKWSRSR